MKLEQHLVEVLAKARAAAEAASPAAEVMAGVGREAMMAAARAGGNAQVVVNTTPTGAKLVITGRGSTAARTAANQALPGARAELAQRWREKVLEALR